HLADFLDRKEGRTGVADKEKPDRRHLDAGFPLGETRYGHADTQPGEILAQAGDEDLAAQNDKRGKHGGRRDSSAGGKNEQGCTDEQLVGDWVEKATDLGMLFPAPRKMPVEIVGDAGGGEEDAGDPLRITAREVKSPYHQR